MPPLRVMPNRNKKSRAVILLSGGLDSSTTLFIARSRGYICRSLILDYGQRHTREISSAVSVARRAGSAYNIIKIAFPWNGSPLIGKAGKLPEGRTVGKIKKGGIPSTYVPARNTVMLSYALAAAESIGASAIFIGANALDYSGYPDCRPDYIDKFNELARLGTRAGREARPIRIYAPLIDLTKSRIIKKGLKLGVPYELTWSCYKGAARPCGMCDSCILREKGFEEAGAADPLLERAKR